MFIRLCLFGASLALSGCSQSSPASTATATANADEFMARLGQYCGQAFEGEIVSNDAADDDWRSERIVAHLASCTDEEVRIPLHVGNDRSRTWLIRQGEDGRLSLHHRHNHQDGTPDALTMYGGKATANSSGSRQTFPADEATKSLFDREEIPISKANVWALEIRPMADLLAYELKRPERFFRVEFDLSDPVETPPDPW